MDVTCEILFTTWREISYLRAAMWYPLCMYLNDKQKLLAMDALYAFVTCNNILWLPKLSVFIRLMSNISDNVHPYQLINLIGWII